MSDETRGVEGSERGATARGRHGCAASTGAAACPKRVKGLTSPNLLCALLRSPAAATSESSPLEPRASSPSSLLLADPPLSSASVERFGHSVQCF